MLELFTAYPVGCLLSVQSSHILVLCTDVRQSRCVWQSGIFQGVVNPGNSIA